VSVIQRIRRAIRAGRYDFTDHARQETEADDLWIEDVLAVLLSGEVDSAYGDDPRGPRYVVRGMVEGAVIDVVCRFQIGGSLLIVVTVYVVD
jgi:hypothetical protein